MKKKKQSVKFEIETGNKSKSPMVTVMNSLMGSPRGISEVSDVAQNESPNQFDKTKNIYQRQMSTLQKNTRVLPTFKQPTDDFKKLRPNALVQEKIDEFKKMFKDVISQDVDITESFRTCVPAKLQKNLYNLKQEDFENFK